MRNRMLKIALSLMLVGLFAFSCVSTLAYGISVQEVSATKNRPIYINTCEIPQEVIQQAEADFKNIFRLRTTTYDYLLKNASLHGKSQAYFHKNVRLGKGFAYYDLDKQAWSSIYEFPIWFEDEIIDSIVIRTDPADENKWLWVGLNLLRLYSSQAQPVTLVVMKTGDTRHSKTETKPVYECLVYTKEKGFQYDERAKELIAENPRTQIEFKRNLQKPTVFVQECDMKTATRFPELAKAPDKLFGITQQEYALMRAHFEKSGIDLKNARIYEPNKSEGESGEGFVNTNHALIEAEKALYEQGILKKEGHYRSAVLIVPRSLSDYADPYQLECYAYFDDKGTIVASLYCMRIPDPYRMAKTGKKDINESFIFPYAAIAADLKYTDMYSYLDTSEAWLSDFSLPYGTTAAQIDQTMRTAYQNMGIRLNQNSPQNDRQAGGVPLDIGVKSFQRIFSFFGWDLKNHAAYLTLTNNYSYTELKMISLASQKAIAALPDYTDEEREDRQIYEPFTYRLDHLSLRDNYFYPVDLPQNINQGWRYMDSRIEEVKAAFYTERTWKLTNSKTYTIEYWFSINYSSIAVWLAVKPNFPNAKGKYERFIYRADTKFDAIHTDMNAYLKEVEAKLR